MISFIPKPGNWLITFKKIMACFLFLTAIWLSNILLNILSNNKSFQNYDQNKITVNWDIDKNKSLPNDLVKQGKIVFVDVTADWCLTCKVNKIFVLETKKIKELFKKNNVIILRLDWTKPNDNIKKFLKDKGRYGIPFNEIYTPKITDGKIFPELLSIDIIKEYFEIIE
jgi:suppressor for copper-sensitivity B